MEFGVRSWGFWGLLRSAAESLDTAARLLLSKSMFLKISLVALRGKPCSDRLYTDILNCVVFAGANFRNVPGFTNQTRFDTPAGIVVFDCQRIAILDVIMWI